MAANIQIDDGRSANDTQLEFSPAWYLRNSHVQSILPSLKLCRPLLAHRARAMLQASSDCLLDCGDGVRLLGFHSAHATAAPQQRPLIVLIHGWEGSTDSLYIMSLGGYLYERGYDVFRLNLRDHGPTHHLNEDIFHSCRIAEVVGAMHAIQAKFAPHSLSIAGFSLGGNFALRVAARASRAGIGLRKAIAVCPVLSPHRTLKALESGWFGYHYYFVRKWKHSLQIKQRCFPRRYDFADILKQNDLATMTDLLVQRHSEYPDINTYLNGYSILGDALAHLDIESHVVLAQDDPIIPAVDAQHLIQSPHLHVRMAPRGGHCGFVDRLGRESWADRLVLELLAK